MTKTRIDVDSQGEFSLPIPEEVVEELVLDDGELVEWVVKDGYVELYFG